MPKSSNKLTTDQLGRLIYEIETRSLPTLARSYPCRFTFYVAHPIRSIRSERVMLGSDLASIYGVETKALNRAVKRNRDRFPKDFVFRISEDEWKNLRYQIGTSSLGHGGRRNRPYVFIEHGAIMAANVLNSRRAVQMNTTCGDAVGWTALSVWETGERSGERESTSPSCAHSCSCAGSWTRIAISLARSKPLRRNTTRNSRWSSKRSSNSLLRPSRQSAELAFTNPKSRRSLLTDHDIPPVFPPNFRNPHSVS